MKRIISLIVVICLLISLLPIFVYAEENRVLVKFEVSETNSCTYDNFLIKRGFPLKKGVIYDENTVVVKNLKTNDLIVPQTKALEKYEDGSIKWILVSMRTDLAPNETKEYALCKQKTTKQAESELNVISNEQEIIVDNGVYHAEFDGIGIKRLSYKGSNILDERGEESVVKLSDGEHVLRVGSVSIEEQGSEFVRIKVEAEYYGSPLRVEKVYTVVAGSNKVLCDTRNISYNGTGATTFIAGVDVITSVYDKFNLNAGYNQITSNSAWIDREGNEVSEGNWVSAYSAKDGAGIIIASNDIAKFKNAVSELPAHNGFVKANGGKSLFVAPILYENPYNWVDGFSRTTHHFIVVYDEFPDIEGYIAGEYNSPQIMIDPQAFIDVGLLGSTYLSAPARAQIESLKWTKDKRNGRITAGSIPFGLDPEKGEKGGLGSYDVQLGEISYNAWFGVLATGDGILYDIVNESCEEWADAMIYRGVVEEARGAGRYRVTETGSANGHMYYSEFSCLYLAYLMTGNMYYYDSCKLMADLVYKVSMNRSMSGFNVPKGPAWSDNKMQMFSTTEIRESFQIQSMYNASKLFQNEGYAYIASQIEKWVEAVQEEDGSWAQFINPQGGITLYAVSWPLYKNYISLYTARGHCDYYEQTHDRGTLEMLSRFADYLINEIGDRGWMYDPCTNKEKCETGEDYSRGKAPIQEIMASEIFYTVYKSTGQEKYLKAFCQVLESYFSTSRKSGLASQRYWDKDYGEKINGVMSGQNLTLMRMDTKYAELIQNKRDQIEDLGFKALAAMYCDNASPDFSNTLYDYDEAEVSVNLYKTDKDERYLFLGNNSGAYSGDWDKEMKIRITEGAGVWTNADNIVRNDNETEITHPMSMFDSAVCYELPLKISSVTGEMHIKNAVITDNGFSFDVESAAGKIAFTLTSGGKLSVSGEKTKHVTAELSDNESCDSIVVSFSDDKPFTDIIGNWAENDIVYMYNVGIAKGFGKKLFKPDSKITIYQAVLFTMRILGISDDKAIDEALKRKIISEEDVLYLDSYATREKLTDIIMKGLDSEIKTDGGLIIDEYITATDKIDDSTAVHKDAEMLSFESTDLYSDIRLPSGGIHGSKITWTSSDDEHLSAEGRVVLAGINEEDIKVTLTAKVSRGNASEERSFDFTVKNATRINYVPGSNFDVIVNTVPIKDGDVFSLKTRILKNNTDYVLGFYKDDHVYNAYGGLSMIIRFNPQGYIDAYNGSSGYSAETEVPYKADTEYTITFYPKLNNGKFDVDVEDELGRKFVIGKNYDLRRTAGAPVELNRFSPVGNEASAVVTMLDVADTASKGLYGLDDADVYYGITRSDVKRNNIEGYTYYSSDSSIITSDGKYVAAPENDAVVSIIGVPKDYSLFDDWSDISSECFKSVFIAKSISIVQGDGNLMKPKDNVTRAEAITMVKRLKEYMHK